VKVPALTSFQSERRSHPCLLRANRHVRDHSYEIYTSFTLWPVEVRKDLRAGIRAKIQGDLALSERFLARCVFAAVGILILIASFVLSLFGP
jgi:hypothetical protein